MDSLHIAFDRTAALEIVRAYLGDPDFSASLAGERLISVIGFHPSERLLDQTDSCDTIIYNFEQVAALRPEAFEYLQSMIQQELGGQGDIKMDAPLDETGISSVAAMRIV